MNTKWSLFFSAAFFGAWALLSNGVPLAPVLGGIACVAALNAFHRRRAAR